MLNFSSFQVRPGEGSRLGAGLLPRGRDQVPREEEQGAAQAKFLRGGQAGEGLPK